AQLRGVRTTDPSPARADTARSRTRALAGRRVLPDREPLPLQREVLPALGAALPALRADARSAPCRPGSALGRRSGAATADPREAEGLTAAIADGEVRIAFEQEPTDNSCRLIRQSIRSHYRLFQGE